MILYIVTYNTWENMNQITQNYVQFLIQNNKQLNT